MSPFALLPLAFALLAPVTPIDPTSQVETTARPVAAGATADAELAPGRVSGPGVAVNLVEGHATDSFEVLFRGGEIAAVVVQGDGDTDLDLFVYDENGNLIASDVGTTDVSVATWTPRWTGRFRVEVRNLGDVYNRYRLETN